MFKRAAAAALALTCAAAIFGTGFALWNFSAERRADGDLGVRVTQSATLGKFQVRDIMHAVIDGGTGAGVNPTITGVSFYKNDPVTLKPMTDTEFTVTFQADANHIPELEENEAWRKVTFGIRLSVPESMESFLTHTEFYNTRLQANGYLDLKQLAIEQTDHFGDPELTDSDFFYENGLFTFRLTTVTLNRFFTYVRSAAPDSLDRYGALPERFSSLFRLEFMQSWEEGV
jgi:hypothetical protein